MHSSIHKYPINHSYVSSDKAPSKDEKYDHFISKPLSSCKNLRQPDTYMSSLDVEISRRKKPIIDMVVSEKSFKPVRPNAIKVPDEILDSLKHGKRFLVVGHALADGDSQGSITAMCRFLRSINKEAYVYSCGQKPGYVRKIEDQNLEISSKDFAKHDFDTLVMLDVSDSDRIGSAKELIPELEHVIVIDHHRNECTKETLGMKTEANLTTWINPVFSACALQVAGAISHLWKQVDNATRKDICTPLMVGMCTDTGNFQLDHTSRLAAQVFKYFLKKHFESDLFSFMKSFEYELPACSQGILSDPPDFSHGIFNTEKGHQLKESFMQIQKQKAELFTLCNNFSGAGLVYLPNRVKTFARQVAKLEDPKASSSDVMDYIKIQLGRLRKECGLSILITESDDGFSLSFRSQISGEALKLGRAFGGGGHANAAGGRYKDGTIDDLLDTLEVKLNDIMKERKSNMKLLGYGFSIHNDM